MLLERIGVDRSGCRLRVFPAEAALSAKGCSCKRPGPAERDLWGDWIFLELPPKGGGLDVLFRTTRQRAEGVLEIARSDLLVANVSSQVGVSTSTWRHQVCGSIDTSGHAGSGHVEEMGLEAEDHRRSLATAQIE